MGYFATAPPPTLIVELPRSAPKPFPQMVTHSPALFSPPVLGPDSRSEKNTRGDWAFAERQSAARRARVWIRLRIGKHNDNRRWRRKAIVDYQQAHKQKTEGLQGLVRRPG